MAKTKLRVRQKTDKSIIDILDHYFITGKKCIQHPDQKEKIKKLTLTEKIKKN